MKTPNYVAGHLTSNDLKRLRSIQRAVNAVYNDSGLLTASQRDRILSACANVLEHYNRYYYGESFPEIQKHLEKVRDYAGEISNELYWLLMRVNSNPYLTTARKQKCRKHIRSIQKALSVLKARSD